MVFKEAYDVNVEATKKQKARLARRRVADQLSLYFTHLNMESDPAALLLRVESLLQASSKPSLPVQNQ